MAAPPESRSLNSASRILVRGVNWLGDAVMTTPALQRLRERFPKAHLALLTPEKLADLWLHYPHLNQAITFQPGESPLAVAARLRSHSFDSALVLPNSPRAALEVWLARIPQRVGYARPWRNWLLTQPLPSHPGSVPMRKRSVGEIRRLVGGSASSAAAGLRASSQPGSHHIYHYLHLSAALGADPDPLPPQLAVSLEELHRVQTAFLPYPETTLFLGLNPSAAYGPAKRWPAQSFAAVARQVSKKFSPSLWLLFGSAADRQLCGEIAQLAGVPTLNLAGKTSLRELMALLKLCRVLLTNDSGPMHLAAALGTTVVAPFGSTSPELTGPGLPGASCHYLLKSTAPCSPCFRRDCPIDLRCMHEITVEHVVSSMTRALDHPRPL